MGLVLQSLVCLGVWATGSRARHLHDSFAIAPQKGQEWRVDGSSKFPSAARGHLEAESVLVQLVEEGRLSSETAQAVSDQLQTIRNRASWLAPGEPDGAELLSQEIYQLTLHLDNPHFFND